MHALDHYSLRPMSQRVKYSTRRLNTGIAQRSQERDFSSRLHEIPAQRTRMNLWYKDCGMNWICLHCHYSIYELCKIFFLVHQSIHTDVWADKLCHGYWNKASQSCSELGFLHSVQILPKSQEVDSQACIAIQEIVEIYLAYHKQIHFADRQPSSMFKM